MTASRRRAFTLLEVVVTVLLVGLVALLLYRTSTETSTRSIAATAALSNSRVIMAQQNYAASRGAYATDLDALDGIGRDVTVTAGRSTAPDQVSVAVSTGDTLVVAALGSAARCYVSVVTSLAAGAQVTEAVVDTECTAARYLPTGESRA